MITIGITPRKGKHAPFIKFDETDQGFLFIPQDTREEAEWFISMIELALESQDLEFQINDNAYFGIK